MCGKDNKQDARDKYKDGRDANMDVPALNTALPDENLCTQI